MKGKRILCILGVWGILLLSCVLLSACGRKADADAPMLGIDGYVYVAEAFAPANDAEKEAEAKGESGWRDISFSNGYLYYRYKSQFWRMAVAQDGQAGEAEAVSAPKGSLLSYAADGEGAVYFLAGEGTQDWQTGEWQGNVSLSKQLSDGTEGYRQVLPEISGGILVVGNGHELYLLAEDGIYLFDADGKADGKIETQDCLQDGGTQNLVLGEDGKVYYSVANAFTGSSYTTTLYEVRKGQGSGLSEAVSYSDTVGGNSIYGSPWGVLLCEDGTISQYRPEEHCFRDVMRMQDSNLGNHISGIRQISETSFLVYTSDEEVWYLLTRTPVEDIPQKETLVLATTYPGVNLSRSVTRFNRMSSRYHIIVETFQGTGWQERLDARIVSSDPPDMLDMSTRLDILKYADKQGLEDLTPYLESSKVLNPEMFMECILNGYTVEGRLICIPSRFNIQALMGRRSQVGSQSGWTMEDFQKAVEEYPQLTLLQQVYGYDTLFDNVLVNVCSNWLMERFVDLDSGECRFEDKDFQDFIEWLKEYSDGKEQISHFGSSFVPEELLLLRDEIGQAGDFPRYEILFQEEVTMKGFPTVSGEAVYYGVPADAVGILANSKEKEGAWSFLEFLLTQEDEDGYTIPGRKDLFEKQLEEAMAEDYRRNEKGEIVTDQNGEPIRVPKGGWVIDGEIYNYYAATQEQADLLKEMAAHTDFSLRGYLEENISAIIQEELSYYLAGQKPLPDACRIIQNRVTILLQESGE